MFVKIELEKKGGEFYIFNKKSIATKRWSVRNTGVLSAHLCVKIELEKKGGEFYVFNKKKSIATKR